MTSTITPASDIFSALANSFTAITQASERAAKAREFFSQVDALVVRPKGSISAQTKEASGIFEFRQKGSDGKWVTIKAKCTERTLRAYRFAEIINPETGEIEGKITLSFTVRTYLDKGRNIVGVSSKNSRFDKSLALGFETFRVWGHRNTHQPIGADGLPKKDSKGVVIGPRDYFNVVVASTLEVKTHTQEDPFGNLPEME